MAFWAEANRLLPNTLVRALRVQDVAGWPLAVGPLASACVSSLCKSSKSRSLEATAKHLIPKHTISPFLNSFVFFCAQS